MNTKQLNLEYRKAEPFPNIVIDNLFEAKLIKKIEAEIRQFSDWDGEKQFYGSQKKRFCSTLNKLPNTSRTFIETLNSPRFLKFLEEITDTPHLIPDPYLMGGGFHSISRGGFLKIHADFNWHDKLQLHRRVNILLYLNGDWQEEWGGYLELWDKNMNHCVKKIAPLFNRLVIFGTNDTSFHGHPEPLECPPDISRQSIALYYYTANRPENEIKRGKSVNTDYRQT